MIEYPNSKKNCMCEVNKDTKSWIESLWVSGEERGLPDVVQVAVEFNDSL